MLHPGGMMLSEHVQKIPCTSALVNPGRTCFFIIIIIIIITIIITYTIATSTQAPSFAAPSQCPTSTSLPHPFPPSKESSFRLHGRQSILLRLKAFSRADFLFFS
jgi:hypothetical protein